MDSTASLPSPLSHKTDFDAAVGFYIRLADCFFFIVFYFNKDYLEHFGVQVGLVVTTSTN